MQTGFKIEAKVFDGNQQKKTKFNLVIGQKERVHSGGVGESAGRQRLYIGVEDVQRLQIRKILQSQSGHEIQTAIQQRLDLQICHFEAMAIIKQRQHSITIDLELFNAPSVVISKINKQINK